jgi:hypothetical protein
MCGYIRQDKGRNMGEQWELIGKSTTRQEMTAQAQMVHQTEF